jgi:hypothetical protein
MAVDLDEASFEGGPPAIFGKVLAPQLVTPGTACLFSSDPSQAALSSGVLDVSLRDTYEATYLLGNRLPAMGEGGPETMTSYVNVGAANVRITTADGVELFSYTRLASTVIAPASGGTPGYGVLPGVTIVDSDTAKGVAPQSAGESRRVITFVRFLGQTLGGDFVESDEVEFPVEVCRACLVSFSSQDVDPSLPLPNCAGSTDASTGAVTVPCDYEDLPVDCSACQGFSSACQGPLASPAGGILVDAGTGEVGGG